MVLECLASLAMASLALRGGDWGGYLERIIDVDSCDDQECPGRHICRLAVDVVKADYQASRFLQRRH
ncbi:hypothetical protein [Magnetospirillum sp. 15-1]|uniref:hypothetical protein n=1 Tax=Magnetospirillum sp. 15-1 TaxID=1979370 RepID=UPI001141FB56|nr:hypothetical protein [Magnetospirillum sp. 15-1]